MSSSLPTPIWRDADYPEALRELFEHLLLVFEKLGLDYKVAEETAGSVCEHFRSLWGGQAPYIGSGRLANVRRKWREVNAKFDGSNHIALAREFSLSVKQIYKILERMRGEPTASTIQLGRRHGR